jgi:hypothetical protein
VQHPDARPQCRFGHRGSSGPNQIRHPAQLARLPRLLRGGDEPTSPSARITRELGRTLHRRGCRGEPAAGRGLRSGALETSDDRLVVLRRGQGKMPCPPCEVRFRAQRCRDRGVRAAPLGCRRRLVHRRTHEGMTKHHRAVAHPHQPGPLGLIERLRPHTERLGRSEDNRQSTGVLSSRDEQRPTGWPG